MTSPPRSIRTAKLNITSLSLSLSLNSPGLCSSRVPDDGSNYIFMLFRHEAGRDCSGTNLSRRPCSQWQMLFVRDNAEERGTLTTKCDSAIANVCEDSSRPHYSVCVDVIIAHRRCDVSFGAVKQLGKQLLSPKPDIRFPLHP